MYPTQLAVYSSASPFPVAAGRSPTFGTVGSGNLKRSVHALSDSPIPTSMSKRREQQSRQPARLPPIAPQPQPSLRTDLSSSSSAASVRSPRTRLPPRSRSGCWTCRTRKVKCDEGRPQCNQCTRLGHVCDYNPRLAFKDETRKIVDKYLGGGGGPSRQWDTSQQLQQAQLEPQSIPDVESPTPFSAMTNEEDWEKKAGHRAPGTYYVIANSASFPSSGDTTPTTAPPRSPLERIPSRRQSLLSISTEVSDDNLGKKLSNIALDDDTVILGSFDETHRQGQGGSAISSTLMLQLESSRYSPGSPSAGSFLQAQVNLGLAGPASLPYPVGRYPQDELRRRHYRTVVRRHMFNVNGNDGTASPAVGDVFEQEVQNFPLLGAAIDALAAWSLAANGGVQNFDTSEQYHKILTSLRAHNTEDDLQQDGMFLTHVLLLVYEISASHRTWYHHLSALLHIFQARGRDLVRRYPLIIWWIALQDVNALLCGSGPGTFVDFIFENNLVPTVGDIRGGQTPGGMSLPQTNAEGQQFVLMLSLMGRLVDDARKIGHLTAIFRQSLADWFSPEAETARLAVLDTWQDQVSAARLNLEQTWTSNLPALADMFSATEHLPEITASIAEQVWFLYHSLVIYSHTSMWPTQRFDEGFAHDAGAVAQCSSLILERTNAMLNRGEFARRLVVLPLFLAGFFSIDAAEKSRAHDLLRLMERASIGNNTRATRRWLQRLFGEQAMAQEAGVPLSVDWIHKIQEQDFCIVHCGF